MSIDQSENSFEGVKCSEINCSYYYIYYIKKVISQHRDSGRHKHDSWSTDTPYL